MEIKTTKDILDIIRKIHQKLCDYYGYLYHIADKQKVKILLDFLCRHENQLATYLLDYENKANEDLLKTWFEYTHDVEFFKRFDEVGIQPTMSFNEVVDQVSKIDKCLENFYIRMNDISDSKEIKKFFKKLLAKQKQQRLNLVIDLTGMKVEMIGYN